MNIYINILLEFLLISTSILLLFKLRNKLGLAPLYIFLGSVQYLQALSGTIISFKVFDEITIYPISVVLFSSVLFAVLLIYIKEGVASARTLIIGIIISNFLLAALFGITHEQEYAMQNLNEIESSSVFLINYKYFILGTIILLLDFILLVIIYQFLISKINKLKFFLTLFISLFIILIFDAFAFNITLISGSSDFKNSLIGHIIGKSFAALIFSIILYIYLKYIDGEKDNASFIVNQNRDVFSILRYRRKYLDLKDEKKQVEKKLESQIETALTHISDGFVSLDTNWCYMYVNIKAGEFLGRKPKSLIGKHIWTEFPDAIDLPFYKACQKATKTKKTQNLREYNERSDKWIENRIYPTSDGLTIYFTDITESKLAKKEIEEMQQKIEAAIRIGKIGYWSWDIINDEVYWSDLMYKIYDVDKNTTLKYDSVVDCIHPEDKDFHNKLIAQRIKDKSNEPFEYRVLWKDNSIKYVMVQMEVIDDESGNSIKFQGTAIDITKRKKAQEHIIKSEKYLDNIINNIGDPVFVKDDQSRFLIANNAFYSLFNRTKEEIIGKVFAEDVPEEERERYLSIDNQVLSTGVPNSHEDSFEVEGGLTRFISTKKTRFTDNLGNKYLIGVIRDITERKNAELQLRKSEKYLDNIINNIGDPLFVKDDQRRLILVNDAFCSIFDLNRSEIIGKTLTDEMLPEEREIFFRIDDQVIETGVENVNEETLTIKGKEPLSISTKKTRFIDNDGNKFLIGTIRDLTDWKKVQKEILALGNRNTLIVETLLDGFLLADTEGVILDTNPAYVNMIGYSKQELLTMNINQLEVALNQSEIEERIKEMVSKGFARFESNHKNKNGELINLDVNTFTMQINDKYVVAAFMKDITESKKAEKELEKYRNQLEDLVKKRTQEVDIKNAELQRMNKLFVGRELRMKELKKIIKELKLKNDK